MSQFRYPGTKPFTRDEKHLFFGRENDIEDVYKLITLEPLVVLFGKSGLGKSSLINAGVSHLLEEKGYQIIFIRFGNKSEENADTIHNIFIKRTEPTKHQKNYLDKLIEENNSFWYVFKSRQAIDGETQQYLLVFDQFEEVFTFSDEVDSFANSLAELLTPNIPENYRIALRQKMKSNKNFLSDAEIDQLYKPLKVKILISIRSDRLSLLNRLSGRLPGILQRCIELLPLSIERATIALIKPAQLKGHFNSPKMLFSPTLLDFIIDYLSEKRTSTIETFQLQMICEFFERRAIKDYQNNKTSPIQFEDDLPTRLVISQITELFYYNILNSFPQEIQIKIRVFIEDGLILEEEKRRISLYKGQIIKKFEISEIILDQLVDKRIIRSETNTSNLPYYELSHDTIIEPVLRAKKDRLQKEEQERILKELEEKRKLDTQINTLQKARELEHLDKKGFELIKTATLQKRLKFYIGQTKLKEVKNALWAVWRLLLFVLFLAFCFIWSIIASYKLVKQNNLANEKTMQLKKSNEKFKSVLDSFDSINYPVQYNRLKQLYNQYNDLK